MPLCQYHSLFDIFAFCPRRSFWPQYDASQSKPLSLSCARELELDQSMLCWCFAAHFFQHTDRALCTSIFSASLGHTYLMSNFVSSPKTSVPIRPLLYPSHGFHTSPLLQVLSPASTSELVEFLSSTLLFVRAAIFQSKPLLSNTEWPWWKADPPPLLQGRMLP